MHRQGGGNLREGEHRRECRRRRNERLLRQKGLYHIMLLWIAWDVYPLWCTLLDCAVVAFIRVISHLKYQVVSVLPSVAPSRHLSFRGAPWMHGYERLEKCEAGELRPRSEITWLSWRSSLKVLSSEHAHRKMNKSHIEMWLARWPTNWNSRHLRWIYPWRWIEIWVLHHSQSIMRDIDLSGSALLN